MEDVLIIGGGVIGASVARELSRYDLSLILVEKGNDLSLGITSQCTGLIKSAIHAIPGTLKSVLVTESRDLWRRVVRDLQIPTTGHPSLTVARSGEELAELSRRFRCGQANGENELSLLTSRDLYKREPLLTRGFKGALLDERGMVIDPVFYTLSLAENACENGVEFHLGETVVGIQNRETYIEVTTEKNNRRKSYRTRYVVNASGLDVPHLKELWGEEISLPAYSKGQYLVLDQGTVTYPLSHSVELLSSNSPTGFGIHRTPYGTLLLGPVKTKPIHRHDLASELVNLKEVLAQAHSLLLKLPTHHVWDNFAGVWESEEEKDDFQIHFEKSSARILSLQGLGTLGFSASPAIGEYVAGLLQGAGLALPINKKFNPARSRPFPHFRGSPSKDLLREEGDDERVICSCSPTREADVRYYLKSPLSPSSLEGLSHRLGLHRLSCSTKVCEDFLRTSLARHLRVSMDAVKERDSVPIREKIEKDQLREGLGAL